MERRPIRSIEDFEVYQKAVKLFEEFLEEDLPILQRSFTGRTLAGNQLRSLDSICANMEEGYVGDPAKAVKRKSGKEIKNFFRMSKGSTGEARERYRRLKKILPEEIIGKRVAVLNEIRAMLESLIQKWK